jgi:hypothetical protein
MRRILIIAAFLGFLIPIICWIGYALFKITLGKWTMFVWPSSIILMATDGNELTVYAISVSVLSVFLNIVLYVGIALLGALVLRVFGLMK